MALASLGLAACQPKTAVRAPCPAGKLCLEYGNGADPISLDPQRITATNEAAILRELIEGLYADGPGGEPVLGVADKPPQVSPDGLVWTFHLRPEVWSDGVPVTADDFVFAYRRILDPKTASSYAYLDYVLKNGQAVNAGKAPLEAVGAKALDAQTLQLTLEHPAPYLPQLLKHQAFFPVPEHVVERYGDAWSQPGHFIGNGTYKLVDWKLSDYVRLVKNDRFRDAAHVCFDQVNFYPTTDVISAERRVLRGELDISNGIQSSRVRFLRADPKSAPFVHISPYLGTSYLIFNTEDKGGPQDTRVRQALSMSIDRAFITDKLLGAGQTPTASFVPGLIAGYVPVGAPHPKPYWADWPLAARQAEAKRLLALAGYGPAHPLKVQIKGFQNYGSTLLMQSIQSDWETIGVRADMRQEDGIIALQSFEIRDFQVGMVAWIADFDDPMTFVTLMKSDTGAQNYGDFKNPAYDALLDKADHEPDGAKRAQYLAQAEQMMLDTADVAPIYNMVNLNLVNPNITGWADNASDIHPIRYLCRRDAGSKAPMSHP
jgi:oligopeptide transport system substrate-binding protein